MSAPWVVRLPTWLGDTVMALPTLRAVATATDEPLLLWGRPPLQQLLRQTEIAFDYLPYRRRPGLAGIGDARRAIAELRKRSPSTAILLPNAFEPALLSWAAGIPRRVGYGTDARGMLLTDVATEPLPRHEIHEAERFAAVARHIGATVDCVADHGLRPTAQLRRQAAEFLGNDEMFIGLVGGSANAPEKRWPSERYAEFALRAHQEGNVRSLLLGSEADRPVTDRIHALAPTATVDAGGGDLDQLMAALLRCRLVVSNDTGAAHLSAALSVPTVVLFGPTDPRRCRPLGEGVLVLSAATLCEPCRHHDTATGHACLQHLGSAEVLEAAAPFWQGSP